MRLTTYFKTLTHPCLGWLERLIKTDIRYLIRGGSAMMLGQIGVSAIGLISAIAFANLLSKEAYGTYQYIITTVEFLTTFSLIGASRAVVTSVSRGYDGTLDFAFKKGQLWGSGAIAIGIIMGGYYLYKGDMLFALGITFGTALVLLTTNAKIYISFLNAKKLFGLTSSFTVLGLLIPALVLIATLFITKNLVVLLSVYFVVNALTNTALLLWCRKYIENDTVDPTFMSQSIHLSAQSLIGRVGGTLDRILLFQFAGPIVLAEFWIAQNIQRNFSHLFKSANSIVLPKLTTRSYEKLRSGLPRKILFLYGLIILFTIGYVAVTPIVITLLFPNYTSIIFLTQILGVYFLFLPIHILSDVFVGHGMNRALYRVAVISSSTKLLCTVTLVPLLGIWGVIFSGIIEQMTFASLVLWHFFKDTPQT